MSYPLPRGGRGAGTLRIRLRFRPPRNAIRGQPPQQRPCLGNAGTTRSSAKLIVLPETLDEAANLPRPHLRPERPGHPAHTRRTRPMVAYGQTAALRDFPWHSHHYLLKVTLAIAVQQCKPPPVASGPRLGRRAPRHPIPTGFFLSPCPAPDR